MIAVGCAWLWYYKSSQSTSQNITQPHPSLPPGTIQGEPENSGIESRVLDTNYAFYEH